MVEECTTNGVGIGRWDGSMMDFQLIALPRSATTWAANWLTYDGAICYHDPLSYRTLEDLDAHEPGREWGVSCTGLWIFDEWLASYDCPRVILERDIVEINDSLTDIGFGYLPAWCELKFKELPGKRFHYSALFDPDGAAEIWSILRKTKFDVERHKILCEMAIQPDFSKWSPDMEIMAHLLKDTHRYHEKYQEKLICLGS